MFNRCAAIASGYFLKPFYIARNNPGEGAILLCALYGIGDSSDWWILSAKILTLDSDSV